MPIENQEATQESPFRQTCDEFLPRRLLQAHNSPPELQCKVRNPAMAGRPKGPDPVKEQQLEHLWKDSAFVAGADKDERYVHRQIDAKQCTSFRWWRNANVPTWS